MVEQDVAALLPVAKTTHHQERAEPPQLRGAITRGVGAAGNRRMACRWPAFRSLQSARSLQQQEIARYYPVVSMSSFLHLVLITRTLGLAMSKVASTEK